MDQNSSHELLESTSDFLDTWREVDEFYANNLSQSLFMGVKKSREWQIFQWYDGITPQFHWDLEDELELNFKNNAIDFVKTQDGCYRITKNE